MRLLWIATKSPWPPIDGGRLLQWLTLSALRGSGVEVDLVAPVAGALATTRRREILGELESVCVPHLVPVAARGPIASVAQAGLRGLPITVARHRWRRVAAAVEERLGVWRPEIVHVEQLQAVAQAEPALAAGIPVVLRAQNVESDLWAQVAARSRGVRRWSASIESSRLARREGDAVARVSLTLSLSDADSHRLQRLASAAGRVEVLPAPFPASLPASPGSLPGSPAVVLAGSDGWFPNHDALEWFLTAVWPIVSRRLPDARLHVFGGGPIRREAPAAGGIHRHPSPEDSGEIFVAGSVLVVPLRIASGVRMKILEAWARGVVVVATPQAASGLDAEDGRELDLAADGAGFAAALARLQEDPELVARRREAGREALARHHDPVAVAGRLAALYDEVLESSA